MVHAQLGREYITISRSGQTTPPSAILPVVFYNFRRPADDDILELDKFRGNSYLVVQDFDAEQVSSDAGLRWTKLHLKMLTLPMGNIREVLVSFYD